jgi:hypothetical protein
MNEEIRQRLENLEEHKGSKLVSPYSGPHSQDSFIPNLRW